MKIWMVAREYAGIAEAGGVKNVVCSLAEELTALGNQVTVFLPLYGCTDYSSLKDFTTITESAQIQILGQEHTVHFAKAVCRGVQIVFAAHKAFTEKQNVYVYSKKDLELFPYAKIGEGYTDQLFMNSLFVKAVCQYGQLTKTAVDVIHCHDACTAVLPAIAKTLFADTFCNTRFFVTIHNAGPGYHHEYPDAQTASTMTGLPMSLVSQNLNGQRCEPYLLADKFSVLTTVSEPYAKELCDPDNPNTDGLSGLFNKNGTNIIGITNGIDTGRYAPTDIKASGLPFAYNPEMSDLEGKYKNRLYFLENFADKNSPDNYKKLVAPDSVQRYGFLGYSPNGFDPNIYISFHGRLVHQKGISVIAGSIDDLCPKYHNVRFIINGQGNSELQELMIQKTQKYPGQVIYLCGYDKNLSRLCTACGDFSLYPSEFEPCGLEDFIAQIYGTVPVAHATGGLNKIVDRRTGFTYKPNTSKALSEVLAFLIEQKSLNHESFIHLIQFAARYVEGNYTWKIVAKYKYLPLYQGKKI